MLEVLIQDRRGVGGGGRWGVGLWDCGAVGCCVGGFLLLCRCRSPLRLCMQHLCASRGLQCFVHPLPATLGVVGMVRSGVRAGSVQVTFGACVGESDVGAFQIL